jgi:hypothetical protein
MANTIQINGGLIYTEDNVIKLNLPLTVTVSGITGSRVDLKQPIPTGSYVTMSGYSTLTDVRYLRAQNIGPGGIILYNSNTGSANMISKLYAVGDLYLSAWSGSVPLYATATTSASFLEITAISK